MAENENEWPRVHRYYYWPPTRVLCYYGGSKFLFTNRLLFFYAFCTTYHYYYFFTRLLPKVENNRFSDTFYLIALNWRFFYFLILAEQRQHSLHKMVFVVLSGKKKIVLPLKIVQIFLSVKIKSRRWKQKTIRNITPPRHYFKLGNVRKDRGFVVTY